MVSDTTSFLRSLASRSMCDIIHAPLHFLNGPNIRVLMSSDLLAHPPVSKSAGSVETQSNVFGSVNRDSPVGTELTHLY
ncbi:hypothetical protein BaRGS_00028119, partial [Batillaria attramentaria]